MTGAHARTGTLARLRDRIARIEADGSGGMPDRAALGHDEADAVLQGGLARGAMHEVFAEGRHSAAAAGFVSGLAHRVSADRPLLWVRQDFAAVECGVLSMSGWSELGLDPRYVVTVYAPDVETALRTSADALACDALGAVVMEIWGETRLLDLVASRRLTLTAREERVLRMRFGIGMNTDHTLEEVGQQFSVTRERIRQIEAKALRKLKHPSRSRKLRSFLDT